MKHSIFLFLYFVFLNSFSQQVKPLVEPVSFNTIYSEISTYYDSGYLYLYRNKPFYKKNNGFYDLFRLKLNGNETIEGLERLDDNVNSIYNEGPVTFISEKNLMLVTRNKYSTRELKKKKLKKNILEIVIYKYENGTFEYVKDFPYNSEQYSVGHPSYSSYTNRLYFSSENPDGDGQVDLYYSNITDDLNFETPIHLNANINSKKDELTPYAKNGFLFYSSNCLSDSSNELNIYYVTEKGIEKNEKPKLLPKPINSSSKDYGITFINNTQGYFTSSRASTELIYDDNIYFFDLITPLFEKNNFNLHLTIDDKKITSMDYTVTDKSEKEVIYSKDEDGVLIENVIAETKYFIVSDKNTKTAFITPKKENELDVFKYDTLKQTVKPPIKDIPVITKTDSVKANPQPIILYFNYDIANYNIQYNKQINLCVNTLKQNSNLKLKIHGFTDSRGSKTYNKNLSKARAEAIYDKLIAKGINPNKIIEKIGYGEEKLLNGCADNIICTNKQHNVNRRVELIFIEN